MLNGPIVFEPGEHVARLGIDFVTLRHGIVVERYRLHARDCWLYAIKWHDTGITERGYLANGLFYYTVIA